MQLILLDTMMVFKLSVLRPVMRKSFGVSWKSMAHQKARGEFCLFIIKLPGYCAGQFYKLLVINKTASVSSETR